jgi:hypothetical protein
MAYPSSPVLRGPQPDSSGLQTFALFVVIFLPALALLVISVKGAKQFAARRCELGKHKPLGVRCG